MKEIKELLAAAREGNLTEVERLLQIPKVLASTEGVLKACIEASGQGHLPVVERLLQIPMVDNNIHNPGPDNSGIALVRAAGNGHLPVVERLLRQASHEGLIEAFVAASAHGHLPVVERLWQISETQETMGEANPRDTSRGNKALILAASNGHLEMVKWLLQFERVWLKLQKPHHNALHFAATHDHYTTVLELCKKYDWMGEKLPSNITIKFKGKELSLVDFINEYDRPEKKLATAMTMSYGNTPSGTSSSIRRFPKVVREHVLLLAGLAKPSEKVEQIINHLIEGTNAYQDVCEKSGDKPTAEGRIVAFITSLSAIMHLMGDGNRGNVFRDMTDADQKDLHQAIRVLMEDLKQVADDNTMTQEYAKETGAALQTLRSSLDGFQDAHGRLPNVIHEIIETLDKERLVSFSGDSSKPTRFHF